MPDIIDFEGEMDTRTNLGAGVTPMSVKSTHPGPNGQGAGKLRLVVAVTAVSGTDPTLVVDICGRIGGVNFSIVKMTTITGTGTTTQFLDCAPRDIVLEYTVGGTSTPLFTFKVYSIRH